MKWLVVVACFIANLIVFLISLTITQNDISINNQQGYHQLSQMDTGESFKEKIDNSQMDLKGLSPSEIYKFIMIRLRYLYNSKITWHSLIHCSVLLIFYTVAEYPINLSESSSLTHTPLFQQNTHNYCGGVVANLMSSGAYLNVTFLFGAILYAMFLATCPPLLYYMKVFPLLSCVLFAVTIALWFELPRYIIFILVSIAQVMPWYLTDYDYYVFTTSCNPQYYGFLLSLYGIINTLLTMAISGLLIYPIPMGWLITLCVSLLLGIVIYSMFFAHRYSKILGQTNSVSTDS